MAETKGFASLNQTLLARKGGAKPAMRPQLHSLHEIQGATARQLYDDHDDLGWNDMGVEPLVASPPHQESAEVVSITGKDKVHAPAANLPEVVHQQAGLSARVADGSKSRKSALEQGRRAAFTLRLDVDRHLKLRLASTVLSRSAQDIVTEALDRHLAAMADIESLAETIRKRR